PKTSHKTESFSKLHHCVPICVNLSQPATICANMRQFVPICANLCQYASICANLCQSVPICANLCQFVPIVAGGLEIRKPRPILALCTPKIWFYATPFIKKNHCKTRRKYPVGIP